MGMDHDVPMTLSALCWSLIPGGGEETWRDLLPAQIQPAVERVPCSCSVPSGLGALCDMVVSTEGMCVVSWVLFSSTLAPLLPRIPTDRGHLASLCPYHWSVSSPSLVSGVLLLGLVPVDWLSGSCTSSDPHTVS